MVRFLAVAIISCLAIRSLIFFLKTFWLMKVRSLSFNEVLESCHKANFCLTELIVCHTILMMLFWRIWYWINL